MGQEAVVNRSPTRRGKECLELLGGVAAASGMLVWTAEGCAGRLLSALVRPLTPREPLALPQGLWVVGWPGGGSHHHDEQAIDRAWVGACIGRRLLEAALRRTLEYLTDVSPEEYHMQQEHLPESMIGEDFLDAWKRGDDFESMIEPGAVYPVRAATVFVIYENDRAERLLGDLRAYARSGDEGLLWRLGGWLYASHDGGRALGLVSVETDRMVQELRALPPEAGVFGARAVMNEEVVTVLLRESMLPELCSWVQSITPDQTLVS